MFSKKKNENFTVKCKQNEEKTMLAPQLINRQSNPSSFGSKTRNSRVPRRPNRERRRDRRISVPVRGYISEHLPGKTDREGSPM